MSKQRYVFNIEDHLPTCGQGREEMTRFYRWSFDDACEAEMEWLKTKEGKAGGRGPLIRWDGAQRLLGLHRIYKDGEKSAILVAIFECCLNSLPIPKWCEYAFLESFRKVGHYKAKRWDDVFGDPYPKGTHLETKRQEREYSLRVYRRIRQIKREKPTTPIDGALFEMVGKEFGIGSKTLTEGYYYKEKKRLDAKNENEGPLNLVLRKRRER